MTPEFTPRVERSYDVSPPQIVPTMQLADLYTKQRRRIADLERDLQNARTFIDNLKAQLGTLNNFVTKL